MHHLEPVEMPVIHHVSTLSYRLAAVIVAALAIVVVKAPEKTQCIKHCKTAGKHKEQHNRSRFRRVLLHEVLVVPRIDHNTIIAASSTRLQLASKVHHKWSLIHERTYWAIKMTERDSQLIFP